MLPKATKQISLSKLNPEDFVFHFNYSYVITIWTFISIFYSFHNEWLVRVTKPWLMVRAYLKVLNFKSKIQGLLISTCLTARIFLWSLDPTQIGKYEMLVKKGEGGGGQKDGRLFCVNEPYIFSNKGDRRNILYSRENIWAVHPLLGPYEVRGLFDSKMVRIQLTLCQKVFQQFHVNELNEQTLSLNWRLR